MSSRVLGLLHRGDVHDYVGLLFALCPMSLCLLLRTYLLSVVSLLAGGKQERGVLRHCIEFLGSELETVNAS